MNNYYVQVFKYDIKEPIEEHGPMSENRAYMVDSGININMNHDYYYTLVVQK